MQFVKLHPKVKLAYSEVDDGNVDLRFGTKTEVKESRKLIFKEFGIKSFDVIEAQQVHGTRILPLYGENSKMWRGQNVTGVDGFVTNQTGIAIMLRLADCVPLVLYDPEHRAVGVFHLGWRATVKNLHSTGLDKLIEVYKSNPRSLLAWLGPSAQSCCYQADKEPDQVADKQWKPYIRKRQGVWKIDLPGFIAGSLKQRGVLKKNTKLATECTIEEESLYSHQRSVVDKSNEGRFAVLVKLV